MPEGHLSELLLEAAYRAEFSPPPSPPDTLVQVEGRHVRVGELRSLAMIDLSERIETHSLLRRADDTARIAALRFVERRLSEADKIGAFDNAGSFHGFLRRVVNNLLLDWLRSPAGKAELKRAEHDPSEGALGEEEPLLPREEFEDRRRLTLNHLVALRAIQSLPPGRGVPLRLALWPAYELQVADIETVGSFACCHETSRSQAEGRACDAGKRCPIPTEAWRAAYRLEIEQAQIAEPAGFSRKVIAELTRIGRGKPVAKREGAICERISKGRLQIIEDLRRTGIRGTP